MSIFSTNDQRFNNNGEPFPIFCDIWLMEKQGVQVHLWVLDGTIVKAPEDLSHLKGKRLELVDVREANGYRMVMKVVKGL